MVYDLSNFTNVTSPYVFFQASNQLADGYVIPTILASLFFIILFAGFDKFNFKELMIYDSFIVTFIAVFFWIMGFIALSILFIPIAILAGSLIYKFLWD